MGRKVFVVALGCTLLFLFLADLGNAVNKTRELAPPITSRRSRFVSNIELLPGVELPQYEKALANTLAIYYFDGGGEEEWIQGWVPYGFHCDTEPRGGHSAPSAWWMGDPAIGGYQDIWGEGLETPQITLTADTVQLSFYHWIRCETPEWDGGNVWMSTDGGTNWQVIFPDSCPYDSILRAWEAHGDTAVWGWARHDSLWRYAEFNESLGVGTSVIFRFEFKSDWYVNTADDTSWFGWTIDDILVKDGGVVVVESNCEAPDTTMYPVILEPPTAWAKSTWDTPPSSPNSWRAEDDPTAVPGPGEVNSALTSPWIPIPDFAGGDSVRKVEIEFKCNEYVPGAGKEFLEDYYSIEIMTKHTTTGWPPFPEGPDTTHKASFWVEMFHEYDHEYELPCYLNPPPESCDCEPNWRVIDRTYIYNGYATLEPAIGDTVRFRYRWTADSIVDAPEVWCKAGAPNDRGLHGMFIDNFVVTGGAGFAQDVMEIWKNEATRPITMGVMVGQNYQLTANVYNDGYVSTANQVTCKFTLMTIDTLPDPDDTTYFNLGNCIVPAGLAPKTTAQCNVSWTPTADQLGDYVEELICVAEMSGDLNTENDTLRPLGRPYNVNVTPQDTLMLGYDVFRSFYGITVDSSQGYAVRFTPHTLDTFQLSTVTFLPAYGGLCRVWIFGEGPNDSTPGCTLAVTDTFTAVSPDTAWTVIDASTVDTLKRVPGDRDFWVWVEEFRSEAGDTCGMSSDESTINGEHSYTGSPDSGFVKESPRDFLIRAWINEPPPAYACGDANGDGRISGADATYIVVYIYRGGPAPVGPADVNLDGRITGADGTYITSYIYRGGPPPCNPPVGYSPYSDEPASVAFSSPRAENGIVEIPVVAEFGVPLAFVHLQVTYDPTVLDPLMPELTSRTEGLDLFCEPTLEAGRLKLGMLSLKGDHFIKPGDGAVVMFRFKKLAKDADISSLRIEEAILVDEQSRELKTTVLGYPFGPKLPTIFSLSQNYPNPLSSGTDISYALPKDVKVRIEVYNVLGEKVKTLVDHQEKAGYKVIHWDGADESGGAVAPGIYFYRIVANGFTATKKMIVLR